MHDGQGSAIVVAMSLCRQSSVASSAWQKAGFGFRCLDELIFWAAGLSILTGQSWRWIDLRFAGPTMQWFLPGLWLVSLVGLAITRHVDFPGGGPITAQRLQQRLRMNRLLLLPTWLIIVVLCFNTLCYYTIWYERDGNLAFIIPMGLPVLIAVLLWMAGWPGRALAANGALPPPLKHCRRWQRSGYDNVATVVILLFMLWIFEFALRADPPPRNVRVNLAVVFGNKVLPGEVCGQTMWDRTFAAVALYGAGRVGHIMVSGRAPYGAADPRQNETLAMYDLCRNLGVPAAALIKDFHGDNTRYSVYDAVALMKEHHWKTVVGVSSDYHLPRIRLSFAQLGVRAWTLASHGHQWRETNPFALVRELVAYPVYLVDTNYHKPWKHPP